MSSGVVGVAVVSRLSGIGALFRCNILPDLKLTGFMIESMEWVFIIEKSNKRNGMSPRKAGKKWRYFFKI